MDQQPELTDRPEHESSGAMYVFALVALLVLTGVSFGLSYVPLGALGSVAAFAIAALKVAVVGLIFMELLGSLAATRLIPVVTILFVILLCVGIAGDVSYR